MQSLIVEAVHEWCVAIAGAAGPVSEREKGTRPMQEVRGDEREYR